MVGATVISIRMAIVFPYILLFTQYRKDDVFWVQTVLGNGVDDWRIESIIKEVPEEEVFGRIRGGSRVISVVRLSRIWRNTNWNILLMIPYLPKRMMIPYLLKRTTLNHKWR